MHSPKGSYPRSRRGFGAGTGTGTETGAGAGAGELDIKPEGRTLAFIGDAFANRKSPFQRKA